MQIFFLIELWAFIGIFTFKATETTVSFYPVSDETVFPTPENTADFNYHLPNETYPEHYVIEVTTNIHRGKKTFWGQVKIDIVVENSTSDIVLHQRQLNISEAYIKNSLTGSTHMLLCTSELGREFLILRRADKGQFAAGTKWKLTIYYRGKLRTDKEGFHLSKYTDNEGNKRYVATAQFVETYARSAFPCYDEPSKRANFTIIINHSPKCTAISNMPVNEALSRSGKTVFLSSPAMPTSLVGFVVSEFEYTEVFSNGLRQRVYYHPNERSRYEWVLKSATVIEKYLSDYFGAKLMLPKLDHVIIPDLNPEKTGSFGFIIYHEDKFLYHNNSELAQLEESPFYTLANEMAHQWITYYVPIGWWTSSWIKEALAYFFSYKALFHNYPDLGGQQLLYGTEYQPFFYAYGDYSYRTTLEQVEESYDLSYLYKTVYVLLMWNNALTEKNFQIGLRKFLVENKYNAVSGEKFFEALQTAVDEQNFRIPESVGNMMKTWLLENGLPILTVTRNYDDGTFVVIQEDFYLEGLTWYVPINYAVASNPDFNDTRITDYLLDVYETKFQNVSIANEDWLILNKQSFGFYLINYDARNWDLIIEGLLKDPSKIHPRNRAQLLADALSFQISGKLDHAILLKLMTYLKYEDQYAPWLKAFQIIDSYNINLMGSEKHDHFKFFVAEQIRPIYKKLTTNDIRGEPYLNKYLRQSVISRACESGLRECLTDASNKLSHLVNETKFIKENFDSTIYCSGLRQSDDKLFNLVYQRLMESTDSVFRVKLIQSMACTRNENQIKKFINSTTDTSNGLHSQERYTLLSSVYSQSAIGLLTCIEFLNEKWNIYGNLTNGKRNILKNVGDMALLVMNQKQKDKFLALVNKLEEHGIIDSSEAKTTYGRVPNNFKRLEKLEKPVMRWLAEYRNESPKSITK